MVPPNLAQAYVNISFNSRRLVWCTNSCYYISQLILVFGTCLWYSPILFITRIMRQRDDVDEFVCFHDDKYEFLLDIFNVIDSILALLVPFSLIFSMNVLIFTKMFQQRRNWLKKFFTSTLDALYNYARSAGRKNTPNCAGDRTELVELKSNDQVSKKQSQIVRVSETSAGAKLLEKPLSKIKFTIEDSLQEVYNELRLVEKCKETKIVERNGKSDGNVEKPQNHPKKTSIYKTQVSQKLSVPSNGDFLRKSKSYSSVNDTAANGR